MTICYLCQGVPSLDCAVAHDLQSCRVPRNMTGLRQLSHSLGDASRERFFLLGFLLIAALLRLPLPSHGLARNLSNGKVYSADLRALRRLVPILRRFDPYTNLQVATVYNCGYSEELPP